MKISIVIPAYGYKGEGGGFMLRNLSHIRLQSYENYEVIVSDHSSDDEVQRVCDKYSNVMDIRHIYNKKNKGNSSANLNNAIKYATGDVIKPIFQDDWLYSIDALSLFNDAFENGSKWVVSSNHSFCEDKGFFNAFTPKWNDNIVFGKNTLSSPSCMAYLNNGLLWNELLIWLMDCWFYHQLYLKYGEPTIINKILVTNYGHDLQYTNMINDGRKKLEGFYVRTLYGGK